MPSTADFDPIATPPRVALANHYPFQPAETVGPMRSESDLFLVCTDGHGRITVAAQTFAVTAGTIVHVPWATVVELTAARARPMVLIGLHFSYRSWSAAPPGLPRHSPATTRPTMPPGPQPFADAFALSDDGHGLIELAVALADAAAAPALGGEVLEPRREAQQRAAALLFLERLAHVRVPATGAADRQHALVRELESWMGLHLARAITRAELARRAGLSESALAAAFRAVTGRGPIDRLIDLRVERAVRRLRTSSASVATIAAEVGIPDPHYFARVLRARTGHPPRGHRRRSFL